LAVDLFDPLARRNPGLVAAAATLHQQGIIPPDCYVADLETIEANARLVQAALTTAGLEAFFEAKQFGRCPPICRRLVEAGFRKALAIDIEELYALERNGIEVGHAGHLGQIPSGDVAHVVRRTRPNVITVYSLEKAAEIAAAARQESLVQGVALRINGPDDIIPLAIAGGVSEADAVPLARKIRKLEGVSVDGFTTYPAVRFDLRAQEWVPTANLYTMVRVANRMRAELGLSLDHINAAGNICVASAGLVAAAGATHCEPGQAFVGGLVANGFRDEPEVPAVAYVTEVSHIIDGTPYVYTPSMVANNTIGIWSHLHYDMLTGALSRPGVDPLSTLVYAKPQQFAASDPTAFIFNAIQPRAGASARVGDTVVFGFRTQLYRTNGGRLALVEGIHGGEPQVLGFFDRNGNTVDSRPSAPVGVNAGVSGEEATLL
jgi:predicted amino acid racemase